MFGLVHTNLFPYLFLSHSTLNSNWGKYGRLSKESLSRYIIIIQCKKVISFMSRFSIFANKKLMNIDHSLAIESFTHHKQKIILTVA